MVFQMEITLHTEHDIDTAMVFQMEITLHKGGGIEASYESCRTVECEDTTDGKL